MSWTKSKNPDHFWLLNNEHAMFELIKGRKQAIWVLLEEKMAIYLCPFILFSYLTLIQNPHDMIY